MGVAEKVTMSAVFMFATNGLPSEGMWMELRERPTVRHDDMTRRSVATPGPGEANKKLSQKRTLTAMNTINGMNQSIESALWINFVNQCYGAML